MVLGINKAPIVLDLESVLFRVAAQANPHPIGRGECICVIFQNPLLGVDGTTPNTGSVYIGNSTDMIWLLIPGQESPMIYAEDLKDIYVKLIFPFPNPNGVILTLGFLAANRGAGYVTGDVITILSPGGTDATATIQTIGAVTTAVLGAGGAGYTIGDVLTLTGTGGATVIVDTVDGGGAVLTFHLGVPGTAATVGVKNTTGGTGAGATFDVTVVTGGAFSAVIGAGGTLFVAGSNYATSGGSGAGAIATVDTVSDTVPSVSNLCCLMYRQRKGGKQ